MNEKKKIGPQLAAFIAQHPGKIYPVVIVCSSNNSFQDLRLTRLMEHIFSGELSGSEIKKLGLLDEVLSIELDKKITVD